ncbi:MAG TPA: ABC transporter permease [Acidimicrobiia bacterium]|nr:ABC transporter permease [Acidimicrobiia bacterium]
MNTAAFINGIAVGGVAALLAVGISQIFTTSGVLNFAHAGFAMLAAYLYAWLAVTQEWPVAWAALMTVVVVSGLGTLAEFLVLRRLAEAPFITKVIVTLGLYVFMQGVTLQLFGFEPKTAPLLLKGGISIGDTVAAYQQIAILAVGLVLMGGLALFLRATRLGLATRSCAQDRATAGLIGIPTRVVSSVNWTIGAFMAAVAGVLIAPLAVFTVDSFSIYLVTGIGAALFGGLTGLTGAFAGGLILGVAQNWAIAESSQPGIWALAIFVAIASLLLLRRRWPKELLAPATVSGGTARRAGGSGWILARLAFAVGWGLLLFNALRVNFWAYTASLVLFYVLVALSLVVAGGWTGQLSLGQGALVGTGVFTMLELRNDHGFDFFPALAVTLLVGVAAGLVFGALSLRLASTQVAIATLAMSLVASEWLFTKGLRASEFMPVPSFLASDRKLFAGMAVAVAAAFALLWRLQHSQWGLAFLATRDAPDMAAHFGVGVRAARLWAFALSGGIAALAGVGYGLLISVVPPYAVGVPMSINVLVFTVVGGLGSLVGPFIGPLLFIAGPQSVKSSQTAASALPQLLGGGMVVLVLLARPEGLGSFLRRPAAAAAPVPSRRATAPAGQRLRLSGQAVSSRLRRAAATTTNGHRPVPTTLVLEEGGTR